MESAKENTLLLNADELRVGMFVHIELGWMDHPFALNKFRIANDQQLADIRGLHLKQVRIDPSRSDVHLLPAHLLKALQVDVKESSIDAADADVNNNGFQLSLQRARLDRCDKSFSNALVQWQSILKQSLVNPLEARMQCNAMLKDFLQETSAERDTHIRLLSESAGESLVLHALNVTVMALLLGRSLGLSESELEDIGMAALLHDMGKQKLPERVKMGVNLSPAQDVLARGHVKETMDMCRTMGLSAAVVNIVSQHHELADGSGYPKGLTAEQMTRGAQIVSLVNIYDNLNNPNSAMLSLTPHEAMSMLFAQRKLQFEPNTLKAFVQLMGVYPPGSVVQLNDDRFAMVVSANATRPHKPSVIVYDAAVPADQALVINLQQMSELSIRRSLHPRNLPPAALEYLSPRKRVCYFFDSAYGAELNTGANA